MKKVFTENAPAAIGPYSQAYVTNGLMFCSGQLPVDAKNGEVAGETIEQQAEQSCKNVQAIVEEAGSDMNHVVKTTCYLSDISNFGAFNEVYADYFISNPARSCFAVKDLPKGVLCEIEAIAEVK